MGAPNDIRKYTEKWMDLFDRFQNDPEEEFVIYCDSVKEAMRIRLEWYKARVALQKEEAALDRVGYVGLGHPNLNRKEAVIKGTNLHFIYKEATSVAERIEHSLKRHDEEKGGGND